MLNLVLLAVGLALLYYGAEYMVEGASKLALGLGVSPLIIGLTVVAFGTSAPELIVSLSAGIGGSPEVAYGNIVGSNICNIALILGAAALIRPLHVDQNSVRNDYPVMLISSSFLVLMAWLSINTGTWAGRAGGVLLLTMLVGYTFHNLRRARAAMRAKRDADAKLDIKVEEEDSRTKDILYVVGGITGLAVGGPVLVEAAVNIAKSLGVSDFVIGVSIIAFGTSLPELATSVVAALKGESDISIGNVIGSNIINVMLVIGVVASFFGMPVDAEAQAALRFDYPLMIGITILLYPIMRTGFKIGRGKAVFLLLFYVGYMVATFLVRAPVEAEEEAPPSMEALCERAEVRGDREAEACVEELKLLKATVGEGSWGELAQCMKAAGDGAAVEACATSAMEKKVESAAPSE